MLTEDASGCPDHVTRMPAPNRCGTVAKTRPARGHGICLDECPGQMVAVPSGDSGMAGVER